MSIPNPSVDQSHIRIENEMDDASGAKGPKRAQGAPLERLHILGDPALRQPTRPVTVFDGRLQKLAQIMMEVMDREEGVGLAAPQIGVASRVMVWRHPERETERHVFVNPRLVETSETSITDTEGCLSVPGGTVEVARHEEVVVEAQDLKGDVFQMRLTGLLARIVQHELDHLDGCLILDRTSPEERRRVLREIRERQLSEGA